MGQRALLCGTTSVCLCLAAQISVSAKHSRALPGAPVTAYLPKRSVCRSKPYSVCSSLPLAAKRGLSVQRKQPTFVLPCVFLWIIPYLMFSVKPWRFYALFLLRPFPFVSINAYPVSPFCQNDGIDVCGIAARQLEVTYFFLQTYR